MIMWAPLLLVVLSGLVQGEEGEEGVCTVEREGCGEEGGSNTTLEEDREKYHKLKWTDAEDWGIRERLDLADQLIAEEPTKAAEQFRWDLTLYLDHRPPGKSWRTIRSPTGQAMPWQELCR